MGLFVIRNKMGYCLNGYYFLKNKQTRYKNVVGNIAIIEPAVRAIVHL